MTPTLEELSDFWQYMLHERCEHNPSLALLRILKTIDRNPHTRHGQFAQALIDFLFEKLEDLPYGDG